MSYEIKITPNLFPYSSNLEYPDSDLTIEEFSEILVDPIIKPSFEYLDDMREEGIDFPYKRLYISFNDMKKAFNVISNFKNRFDHKPYPNTDLKDIKFPTNFFLINFENNFPVSFENPQPYLDIESSENSIDYEVNVITDYFSEFARVQCSRNKFKSVYEGWISDDKFVLKCIELSIKDYRKINGFTLRESIYKSRMYSECPHVKATFVSNLYNLLLKDIKNPKVLDACAGYGDRLIACIALKYRYIGVEPNTRMRGCFKEILDVLGKNSNKYSVLEDYMPDADVGDNFDLCHVSPPSFDSEVYEEDEKQSISMFKNRNDWLMYFLFRMFNRCWRLLKPNGFLVIESILFEEICCYIRWRFPEALYLGTVSVKTNSRNKPHWIFMKADHPQLHKNLPSPKRCFERFNTVTKRRLQQGEDIY